MTLSYPLAPQAFDLPTHRVTLRPLQFEDVRRLEWHGGDELRGWYEACAQAHQDGALHFLIADFNAFPVGQILIHWAGKPTHPHIPDLQSLRVFPAFQGMGIGSKLLEAAEKIVAQQGFAQVSLAVGLENPKARKLYERLGYHAIGEPYDDEWQSTNARGEVVTFCEHVIDLVKTLETSRS